MWPSWEISTHYAWRQDYLRSRRILKTTSAGNTPDEDSLEVDAISRKGKGKGKSGKGKKGGKKGKESHSGKGYRETTVQHSRFEGECRNCGKYGHKAADCWYKQPPKPQGKGEGSGKSKFKVTEISESDSSKQAEETWTPHTSVPQSSLITCSFGQWQRAKLSHALHSWNAQWSGDQLHVRSERWL